ncbi:DNA cytosine methyltransferase, partial [Microbacteriaceae bacterium K1510]|nr:DNA cytosine methyltransferase [Microbacteriaceae bacterium K1510]
MALCAGAGGLELGVHIAEPAYRTVGYVEREAYAAVALVARMEDEALDRAPVWDDLKTFRGRDWRGCVDLVTAGYPCQPFSAAGKRLGTADERHLWPDVRRIIVQVRPRFAFLENVGGHLSL